MLENNLQCEQRCRAVKSQRAQLAQLCGHATARPIIGERRKKSAPSCSGFPATPVERREGLEIEAEPNKLSRTDTFPKFQEKKNSIYINIYIEANKVCKIRKME